MVGKVEKRFLFENPRLDLRVLRGLSRMRDYRDGTLLRAIIAEFAEEGLEVIEQTRLLGHLVTPEGILGKQRPSQRAWDDIRYGFARAKQLAALDIGQTIVVRRQTVLAVEALEGTDAAIERGCQYGGRGTVVVKVSRPQQDMRFDVPTVGPHTSPGHRWTAAVLAVEAGTTLMLRLPELVALADARRVALVGVSAASLQAADAVGNIVDQRLHAGQAAPLLMVAAEASGDQHGAALVRALHERFPQLQVYGLGGDHMRAAGVKRCSMCSAECGGWWKSWPRCRRAYAWHTSCCGPQHAVAHR
jgi:DUF1009 family protein